MSAHRLSAPSESFVQKINAATAALTSDEIRRALPEQHHALLEGEVGVELIHLGRPMTTGNRAALYGVLDVYPIGDDGVRSDTHVLISWTFHQLNGLVLELDRILPVEH